MKLLFKGPVIITGGSSQLGMALAVLSGRKARNAFRLPFVRRARTLRGSGAFLPSP